MVNQLFVVAVIVASVLAADKSAEAMFYWDGVTTPQAPEGICVTIEQYWYPSGDCIDIWKAWDDYCWTNEYSTQDCLDVEEVVWMDPNLLDPSVPDESCYVSVEKQSEICEDQWSTFEDQCIVSFDYKVLDSCQDVYDYTEGWLLMKQSSAVQTVMRPALKRKLFAKSKRGKQTRSHASTSLITLPDASCMDWQSYYASVGSFCFLEWKAFEETECTWEEWPTECNDIYDSLTTWDDAQMMLANHAAERASTSFWSGMGMGACVGTFIGAATIFALKKKCSAKTTIDDYQRA